MDEVLEILTEFLSELYKNGSISIEIYESCLEDIDNLAADLIDLEEEDIKRGLLSSMVYDGYITTEEFQCLLLETDLLD